MSKLPNISDHVPLAIANYCAKLWDAGIRTTAVGGIARDLILARFPLIDWDFEVRPRNQNEKNFVSILESTLGSEAQHLGFGVYRVQIGDEIQLEFSIPRTESFAIELSELRDRPQSHKDFEVTLDASLDFTTAFKRRDLTINAIGLDYNGGQWEWVDPFGGIADLQNKLAKPCSSDFAFDPVRILRAIRFKKLFDLKFDPQILEAFKVANLTLASDHYLLYESLKAGFFPFFIDFFKIVTTYEIAMPETWDELDFLQDSDGKACFLSNDLLLLSACWSEQWGLSEMGKLERFLKLRRGRAKHFMQGYQFALQMSQPDWPKKINDWKNEKWSELKNDELFIRCLEYHKHWESWTVQEEKELIELEAAKTLGLVAWRVFFPRVLVGKEKFEREQAEYEVVPNQRSLFRLWCHLVS